MMLSLKYYLKHLLLSFLRQLTYEAEHEKSYGGWGILEPRGFSLRAVHGYFFRVTWRT